MSMPRESSSFANKLQAEVKEILVLAAQGTVSLAWLWPLRGVIFAITRKHRIQPHMRKVTLKLHIRRPERNPLCPRCTSEVTSVLGTHLRCFILLHLPPASRFPRCPFWAARTFPRTPSRGCRVHIPTLLPRTPALPRTRANARLRRDPPGSRAGSARQGWQNTHEGRQHSCQCRERTGETVAGVLKRRHSEVPRHIAP